MHGSRAEDGADFDAYAPDVDDAELLGHLQASTSASTSSGDARTTPKCTEVDEVLESPGEQFTDLLERITQEVRAIAQANGKTFGDFATAQLSKKLTSSSIAGATTFVRRCGSTLLLAHQAEFEADQSDATNELRRLIKKIRFARASRRMPSAARKSSSWNPHTRPQSRFTRHRRARARSHASQRQRSARHRPRRTATVRCACSAVGSESCQYFQASFLEEVRRFVPIPVGVVRVVR